MTVKKPKLLRLDIQYFAGGGSEGNPVSHSLEQALSGQELLVYSRNLATPNTYLQDLLFPARQTSELTVDLIREGSRLPVMAQVAELGTEIQFGAREGMTGDRVTIPKIQRGRAMEEKLVRTMLMGGLRSAEVEEIRRTQLDDAAYAVDAIKARKEWLAMQAISKGAVQYAEDGVQFAVDFGYTSEQKPVLSGTDLWSDTTASNPLTDIQGWVETQADKGIILSRALASRRVISYLLQNLSLRKAYFGDPSGSANPPQLNQAQLNSLFDTLGLPQVVAYDTQARVENRALTNGKVGFSNVRMMPQDRFVLLPAGELGNFLWAQTTEELVAGIEGETNSNGIFVFRDIEKNPIVVKTMGVNLAFPAFGLNDAVVAATVI
ncbi:major capsid protein [Rossellomorea vietnamensis]|uniref:major capsid protein n=1 Tax=Rossellomorea vietnamensis TaxID=218284 RepID=UPI000552BA75|nr:major capsid protein [Rossellomorea vietnamensis]